MLSNISWPQSCFYNAWRSIRCGFVSEALQLRAHIKYSRQLPGRLKRSMPWIYQGSGGRHTTFRIPKLFLFEQKKEGNKASGAVLLTFAVLGQDLMTTFREKFSQRSVLKRLFPPSLPVTDCPLRDFAAVFIVLREYLSGCCAVCSHSVKQIMIITSPQVSAKEVQMQWQFFFYCT